ncbi:restriction endonuclease subunit S [Vibrio paracholerae]|uniref:restriction endonuclease subunit S n=1 Tax=Vibrio paracholerae TaxID=650003 RepID=UPI002095DE12|nr:restriction endonuclease subunit S [Vibrio paracholerae]MCO7023840.1 restriction endonuclease subunit S [Vibrio paracholerae]
MNEQKIPQHWQMVRFGDIAEHISIRVNPVAGDEKKYIGLEHLDSGNLTVKRWGSEVVLKGQKLKIKKGDILFAKRNAYLKRVALAPFDGIFSAHGMVIRPLNGLVLPEFLPFFMQSDAFMDRAIAISEGSLSPTIKWNTLSRQYFAIPSINEQRSLLTTLKKFDQVLQLKESLHSSVLELKRIMISKFFSKKFLEKYKANKVSFSDTLDIVSGQVDPTSAQYQKYPHIAPDNMEKSLAILLPYRTAEEDGVKSGKYLFDEEHILYSKIRPNLRKVVFPKIKGLCSADVYPLKGKNGLKTDYLFYLLQSEHFNKYAIGTSMRTGMPKINRQDLCAYTYYLPEEHVQLSIVSKLKALDEMYNETAKAISNVFTLKMSYLNSTR